MAATDAWTGWGPMTTWIWATIWNNGSSDKRTDLQTSRPIFRKAVEETGRRIEELAQTTAKKPPDEFQMERGQPESKLKSIEESGTVIALFNYLHLLLLYENE